MVEKLFTCTVYTYCKQKKVFNLKKVSKVACTVRYCDFEIDSKLNCLVDHCKIEHDFKPLPCSYSNCNFVAFNHRGYAQHLSKFHSKHKVYSGNLFSCPYPGCRTTFERQHNLDVHVRVHENNLFSCVFCPYRTAVQKDFADHYRSHYKIFDYKCDLCKKSFVKTSALLFHLENVHKKGEVLKCHYCDYTGTKMKLQMHFRNKHNMACQYNKVTKTYDTFKR